MQHLHPRAQAAPVAVARPRRTVGGRTVGLVAALLATVAMVASATGTAAHDGGLGGFGRGLLGGDGVGRGPGSGIGRTITISAIDGNDLALATDDGWTRTITVTSATTITKAGRTIAVGDLAVGDAIRFSQTANSDGTYTIDAIVVVTPSVAGTVTEVGSGSFDLTARDGTTWTITTTASTTYTLGLASDAAAGGAGDVKVGGIVLVQGSVTSGNAMTAVTVRIQLPRVTGTVTAKTGETITIQRRDGTTTTVHVSSSTTYRVAGNDSASLADVTMGMILMAEGQQRSDGSIDATRVAAGAFMQGGRGWTTPDAAPSASPATTSEG